MSGFKRAKIWSEDTKNSKGLPRPIYAIDPNFILRFNNKLKNRIPVPWQSRPVFNEVGVVFNVIEENEKRVVSHNVCGYCSLTFTKSEQCIRWIGDELNEVPINSSQGPRLFSDISPLHIKCMKQARFFCPYLNSRPDSEFEFGTYSKLKNNLDVYVEKIEKKYPPSL